MKTMSFSKRNGSLAELQIRKNITPAPDSSGMDQLAGFIERSL